jgi:hypothetical protein
MGIFKKAYNKVNQIIGKVFDIDDKKPKDPLYHLREFDNKSKTEDYLPQVIKNIEIENINEI